MILNTTRHEGLRKGRQAIEATMERLKKTLLLTEPPKGGKEPQSKAIQNKLESVKSPASGRPSKATGAAAQELPKGEAAIRELRGLSKVSSVT